MTTETRSLTRDHGFRALVSAALGTVVIGLLVSLVAAFVGGSAAAWGALIGTALVVTVFGFGSFTVNAVASVLPTAALMVALLTYSLQVLVMALVFAGLSTSGLLDDTISRGWLAGTVIAGTFAWIAVQIAQATSRRIPIYDLPVQASEPARAATGDRREEPGE